MPIVNGVNYAKTHAPSDGNWKLVPVSEVGGTMRVLYDSYTAIAATAQNDVLNVGRLPKDSRVWDVQISTSAAFCTNVDVGFAYDDSSLTDDVDFFIDNAGAAGIVHRGMLGGIGFGALVSGVSGTISQIPVTIAGEGIVQVTFLGSDPTATSILKVKVFYTID